MIDTSHLYQNPHLLTYGPLDIIFIEEEHRTLFYPGRVRGEGCGGNTSSLRADNEELRPQRIAGPRRTPQDRRDQMPPKNKVLIEKHLCLHLPSVNLRFSIQTRHFLTVTQFQLEGFVSFTFVAGSAYVPVPRLQWRSVFMLFGLALWLLGPLQRAVLIHLC